MSDIENGKGKNIGKIVSIIFIIVSIILIVCGIVLTVLDNGDSNNKVDDKLSEEVEVDDANLRKEIEDNIKVIEQFSVIGEYSSKNIFGNGVVYSNTFNSSDINKQTKLLLILEKLYSEKVGKSPVTTDFNFGENHVYFKDIQTQINVLEVDTLYKNIFGDDIVHNDMGGCLYFIYDEENSVYYGSSTCNDVQTPYSLDTYISSITNKGDKFYAYISVGSVDYSGGKATAYVDYDMKKLFNGTIRDSNNVVNRNNYKEFSQYKYSFVKNSNGFEFMRVEKISDGLENSSSSNDGNKKKDE